MNKKQAIKLIESKFPSETHSYGNLQDASSFEQEMTSSGKSAIRVKYKDGRQKQFVFEDQQFLND